MNLGRIICWLLRRHKDRRLRKRERMAYIEERLLTDGKMTSDDLHGVRKCRRCGATRLAKRRAAKQ